MWLISLFLIDPVAPHKELSYFSAYEHKPGEIVKIPARGKVVYGLVVACRSAKEARQSIRTAEFSLQKISSVGKKILTNEFLHAAFEMAAYHAVSIGSVLHALVPAAVLEKLEKIDTVIENRIENRASSARSRSGGSPIFLIDSRENRIAQYHKVAKENFEKSKSTLIIAPTIVEVERIAAAISGSIFLHGGLTKKQTLEAWNMIARAQEPLVVVGTSAALALPRKDWKTLIVERILARGYERSARPFLAIRACALKLAEAMGANLVLGSSIVPVADFSTSRTKLFGKRANHGSSQSQTRSLIINMQSKKELALFDVPPSKASFELFSTEAKEKINATIAQRKNVLLLAARRGLAPHTTCDDCGTPLTCPRCHSGLVLYEERRNQKMSLSNAQTQRWFKCSYCNFIEAVHVLCPVCGSWRLSMTGIGLTLVAKEAEKLFPNAQHFIADEKIIEQGSKAKKFVETFEQVPGSIACATEGLLPYLNKRAALAIVVSADSMLFAPEYCAPERALSFLAEARGMATEMLVQTRSPEHPVLAALAQNTKKFYVHEIEMRRTFSYPPFVTLIRLTVSGTAVRTKPQIEAIVKALADYKPERYSGRTMRKNLLREHILLRLPKDRWIDQKLLAFLRNLPPSVEVRINPHNLISD